MTITLRGTKGVELTHAELDGNFTDLDGRVTTLQGYPIAKNFYKYFYEADSGDTVFSGADLQSNTMANLDSDYIMVYKNGILLHELYDFNLSGGNTITLTMPMDSGHDLIITNWAT